MTKEAMNWNNKIGGKKAERIPCPDGVEGCLVAHYKVIEEQTKQEQDELMATLIEHYAFTDGIVRFDGVENMEQLPVGTKLYTTLQQRNPLTDEEIIAKCEYMPDYDIGNHDLIRFARAIEAAHGIKD